MAGDDAPTLNALYADLLADGNQNKNGKGLSARTVTWLLIASATAFNTAALAAVTVLNADVMARAPHDGTGLMSAFRCAASAIGTGLGVVVLGTGVINAVNASAGTSTVSADQVDQIAAALRLDGILGCGIALCVWIGLRRAERRRSAALR